MGVWSCAAAFTRRLGRASKGGGASFGPPWAPPPQLPPAAATEDLHALASSPWESVARRWQSNGSDFTSRSGSPNQWGRLAGLRQQPNLPPSSPELLEAYMNPNLMSSMERHNLDLKRIRENFRRHEGDCGSSEVQIALLTEKIRYMGQHLMKNKKDKHSQVGLDGMLARRRKLLKYLRHKDWDLYCQVISRLGLRDRVDLQR